jgi:hypothetical protein
VEVRTADGPLPRWCRDCLKQRAVERSRRHREAHPEAVKASRTAARAANLEGYREREKARKKSERAKDPEATKRKQRAWASANRGKRAEYFRRWKTKMKAKGGASGVEVKRLPVVQDSPGWGLVRELRTDRHRSHRRPDCQHLREHEEAFIALYGGAQGRCPEGCGGYAPEPPTAALVTFAALLGRQLGELPEPTVSFAEVPGGLGF